MLDKYKDGQPVAYQMMTNAIINNKISHAYLFDSNGNPDAFDIVLSFVKEIVLLDCDDSSRTNVIKRIDDDNYLDVVCIKPDGLWIKKNQIIDLQNEFNKKSIEGRKKIYIIKSAEKMNVQTSNSILKFLEEPIDDIIAILIVDNINLVLPTIISRCQVIKLNKREFSDSSISNFRYLFNSFKYLNYSDDKISEFISDVIEFVNFFENNNLDTIIFEKSLWHNKFKDREDDLLAIELMINFYYDLLKYITNNKALFYKDKISEIDSISKINSISSISKKIYVLDGVKNKLLKNMNINLLIDKMIIDMCGDKNEGSWS